MKTQKPMKKEIPVVEVNYRELEAIPTTKGKVAYLRDALGIDERDIILQNTETYFRNREQKVIDRLTQTGIYDGHVKKTFIRGAASTVNPEEFSFTAPHVLGVHYGRVIAVYDSSKFEPVVRRNIPGFPVDYIFADPKNKTDALLGIVRLVG
jgi:hypothetical protein